MAEMPESDVSSELLLIKRVVHLGLGVCGCIEKSVRMLETGESSSDKSEMSACTWLMAMLTAATLELLMSCAGLTLERFDSGLAQSNNVNWWLDFNIAMARLLTKRANHALF